MKSREPKIDRPAFAQVQPAGQRDTVIDPDKALDRFVNQSSWDEAAMPRDYEAVMAECRKRRTNGQKM